MNNDLISRSALLEEFRDFKDMDCPSGHTITADYMIEYVEDAPAVDAEVVQHGRWYDKVSPNYPRMHDWRCSVCEYSASVNPIGPKDNYCPNCGAKMDAEVEG